jgi:hypothetical protein
MDNPETRVNIENMTENVEKKLKTQHRKGMTRVIIVNMYFVLNSIY